MVRKYNPEVKTEYGRGMWDGVDSHDAVMKEGKDGKWVKLETFENVFNLQRKEIARHQAHIRALKERIQELTSGAPALKNVPCPCCNQTFMQAGDNGGNDNTWYALCALCEFKIGIIGVRPGSTHAQALNQAIVAWNKRAARMRKADAKAAE